MPNIRQLRQKTSWFVSGFIESDIDLRTIVDCLPTHPGRGKLEQIIIQLCDEWLHNNLSKYDSLVSLYTVRSHSSSGYKMTHAYKEHNTPYSSTTDVTHLLGLSSLTLRMNTNYAATSCKIYHFCTNFREFANRQIREIKYPRIRPVLEYSMVWYGIVEFNVPLDTV